MRLCMVVCGLALGLLGCGKIGAGESGIRGQVLVGTQSWVPKPGEMICASKHEESEDPPCAKVGRDGSFEILSLTPGTYWLCRQRGPSLDCPSLCPYSVRHGEVTHVDPSDFLGRMPGDGGFYGTSTGSFGEPGYLDVPHQLRVCVGPPDTPVRTAVAKLDCAETDRCGRYVLGVPEGTYRVLFAEIGDETTSDRQRCRYRVSAHMGFSIDRVTSRGMQYHSVECPEGSTPDPLTTTELRPALSELTKRGIDSAPRVIRDELANIIETRVRTGTRLEQLAHELQVEPDWLLPLAAVLFSDDEALAKTVPPFLETDAQHVAFPLSDTDGVYHVRLRGRNFHEQPGKVTLRALDSEAHVEVAHEFMTWSWQHISFPVPEGMVAGRYEITVTRPDGLPSHPLDAVIVIGGKPAPERQAASP